MLLFSMTLALFIGAVAAPAVTLSVVCVLGLVCVAGHREVQRVRRT